MISGPKFFSKNDPIGVFLCGNRLRAFPDPENASLTLIQCVYWSENELTLKFHRKIWCLRWNFKVSSFSLQYMHLNQSQESIFRVWECAQSIPRIKLPLSVIFRKNFRVQNHVKYHKNHFFETPCNYCCGLPISFRLLFASSAFLNFKKK